ncbi:hypothetical protein GcM1_230069 [Golovinomyces cichoracearum]|uniref:RRM domain-containing protein n=1 Tax=Golovinomyces cichoracearum TaxID=62708 RepID=A0A420IN90_9PEZI|nr:hypothetical protein GcM1_230069 [Golovinomyces cichoracearum]
MMSDAPSFDQRDSSSICQRNETYDKFPGKTFSQHSAFLKNKSYDVLDSSLTQMPLSSGLQRESLQILDDPSSFNSSLTQMSDEATLMATNIPNTVPTCLPDISNKASRRKSTQVGNLNPAAPNFMGAKQSLPYSSLRANMESCQGFSSNETGSYNLYHYKGDLAKENESIFQYPLYLPYSVEKIGLDLQLQSTYDSQNPSCLIEEFKVEPPVLYSYGAITPTISPCSAEPFFSPLDDYHGSMRKFNDLGILYSSCPDLNISKQYITNTDCLAHNYLFETPQLQLPSKIVHVSPHKNLDVRSEKLPDNNYGRTDADKIYSENINFTTSASNVNNRENTMNFNEPQNQSPKSKSSEDKKENSPTPTKANVGTTIVQESVWSKPLRKKVLKLPNTSKTTPCHKSDEYESFEISGGKVFHKSSSKTFPIFKNHLNSQEEFCSEKRSTATTPKVRSRRGKTISAIISSSTELRLEKDKTIPNHKAMSLISFDEDFDDDNDRMLPLPKMNFELHATAQKNKIKALTAPMNHKVPFGVQNDTQKFASSSPSPDLYSLIEMGSRRPSIDNILDSSPFFEYCRLAKEDDKIGVIKIKNIPYSINRAEILAFLGRNARIVSELKHEPIHIIMERITGKTVVCYVEFVSLNEALKIVNRFRQNYMDGRAPKLGTRYVQVELSSQESLMNDLFPKAKSVEWHGFVPKIIPPNPENLFNSGFKGFVSMEELFMLVKHVETPLRSPFMKDCPQRPFECIISTLLKYPWYMADYISIKNRNNLHEVTVRLLKILKNYIETQPEDAHFTPMLYKRVWRAALNCQGFSPSQKDDIVLIIDLPDEQAKEFGLPPFAASWKRLWTIGWYITHIREATIAENKIKQQNSSSVEKSAQKDDKKQQYDESELFGLLHKYIDYGDHSEFYNYSLAHVARAEWAGIEHVLRKIFSTW